MVQITDQFDFSVKTLNELVENEKSGVKVHRKCCRVYQLKNRFVCQIKEGVEDILKSSITKYDVELDGLVLDHKSVKIHPPVFGQDGTLFDSTIAVKVSFDIYYLSFALGSVLEGIVTHIEDKHITCLVHNIFHVSVLRPYDVPFEKWTGSQLMLGDTIEFRITVKLLREDIPYIQGELPSDKS